MPASGDLSVHMAILSSQVCSPAAETPRHTPKGSKTAAVEAILQGVHTHTWCQSLYPCPDWVTKVRVQWWLFPSGDIYSKPSKSSLCYFMVSSSINYEKEAKDPLSSSFFPVALGFLLGELKQPLHLAITHTLDITPNKTKKKTTFCETQIGARAITPDRYEGHPKCYFRFT